MHDPDVVAHDIKIPWPSRPYGLHLVTIYHHDPSDDDSFVVCKYDSHWRWHIHHWQLSFPVLHQIQRRLLTRCAWCGGRHTTTDRVNSSRHSYGSGESTPWWRGETHLDHNECHSIWMAHQLCLCDAPILSNGDYGRCLNCGRHRAWMKGSRYGQQPSIVQRYLASIPEGQRIPDNKRAWVRSEWAKALAERFPR